MKPHIPHSHNERLIGFGVGKPKADYLKTSEKYARKACAYMDLAVESGVATTVHMNELYVVRCLQPTTKQGIHADDGNVLECQRRTHRFCQRSFCLKIGNHSMLWTSATVLELNADVVQSSMQIGIIGYRLKLSPRAATQRKHTTTRSALMLNACVDLRRHPHLCLH